jgi:hypothetical protein
MFSGGSDNVMGGVWGVSWIEEWSGGIGGIGRKENGKKKGYEKEVRRIGRWGVEEGY